MAQKNPGKKKRMSKAVIRRVAPRIIKRVSASQLKPDEEYSQIDTAKSVEFGLSLVEQMKREAAERERKMQKAADEDLTVKLTRRPTSRDKKKQTEKFPANDLKEFRKRLLAALDQAKSGVDAMKATGFNESEDHEADGGDGTAQTMRLQALGQMGNINRTIQKIEEALHRIDDGSYGVCASCGQLIRKARLMNQPFVLTCMECQSEMEKADK